MKRHEVKLLIARQADAWQRADINAIVADFAKDGLFVSPGGRWQGPKAIAEAACQVFAVCSKVEIEIKRLLLDGNQGAVEWIWHETRRDNDQTYTMEDAIIFELQEGKITYWREYFAPL